MNSRNSISNKISPIIEELNALKAKKIITDDAVKIEISLEAGITVDNPAAARFFVTCPLEDLDQSSEETFEWRPLY